MSPHTARPETPEEVAEDADCDTLAGEFEDEVRTYWSALPAACRKAGSEVEWTLEASERSAHEQPRVDVNASFRGLDGFVAECGGEEEWQVPTTLKVVLAEDADRWRVTSFDQA